MFLSVRRKIVKHPGFYVSTQLGAHEVSNLSRIDARLDRKPSDTKKKELIGNYKNGGTDYRPKGDPRRVKVHDFEDKELGKVVPYGVYDVGANAGWVSVGVTSDTAQFAVASIRRWLDAMGRERYPKARELTITADGGGSNGRIDVKSAALDCLSARPRATMAEPPRFARN